MYKYIVVDTWNDIIGFFDTEEEARTWIAEGQWEADVYTLVPAEHGVYE